MNSVIQRRLLHETYSCFTLNLHFGKIDCKSYEL